LVLALLVLLVVQVEVALADAGAVVS
jgi:hypothetical protein